MKQLIDRYRTLSPEKRVLLAKMLRDKNMDPLALLPVLARDPAQPTPLSFAQERLWFVSRMNPEAGTYNMPLAIELRGTLDTERLAAAVDGLIARYDLLRTLFTEQDGKPRQTIVAAQPGHLITVDLSAITAAKRDQALREAVHAGATEAFALDTAPPVRFRLYRAGTDHHVFQMCVHHILLDGQSLDHLWSELMTAYFQPGTPAAAPTLHYADYCVWQRELLDDAAMAEQLRWWDQALRDGLPLLALPLDYPRPKQPSGQGAHTAVQLTPALAAALRALAAQHKTTVFTLCLAAFQAFLYRLTGSTDFNVGTVISGRHKAEVRDMPGLFLNSLALRARLAADQSFADYLAETRDWVQRAFAHAEVPFEQVVRRVLPHRDHNHPPLFQVCFSHHAEAAPSQAATDDPNHNGLQVAAFDQQSEVAKFDLTLEVEEIGAQMTVVFQYAADLFHATTMHTWLAHFTRLLENAVSRPATPIARLALFSESPNRADDERAAVTEETLVTQRFAELVQRRPNAVALTQGTQNLTYAELDEQARRLAWSLQAHGLGPEKVLAICLPRTPFIWVAMLACYRIGAAFVCIDPLYPAARKRAILDSAEAGLLLTEDGLIDAAAAQPVLSLNDARRAMTASPAGNPPAAPLTGDELAYLICTSGTTGRPKSVMLHHHGLANLVTAQQKLFDVGPGDRVLQFASTSFDASVWETAMALFTGATLVLPDQDALLTGDVLLDTLRTQRITIATLPPSVLTGLQPGALPEFRVLVSAGERCPREIVAAWSTGRRFFNAYGPSETTVCATAVVCDGSEPNPPIGEPIHNTQVYILDQHFQPVPRGVIGELFVAGPAVGRGYRNMPRLTAEKFIVNPFGPGRLYRTGDLVRRDVAGRLLFVGRADHQVKLRGFRLELGEIEAHLHELAGVSAAVAHVATTATGPALVAHVIVEDEVAFDSAAARETLRGQLPAHAVPSVIATVREIPKTPNGKIDYAALPLPDQNNAVQGRSQPANPREAQLAPIFAATLQRDQVGMDDDFFAMGGHSLLVTQLLSRLQQQLDLSLSLADFFANPSVAQLAELWRLQSETASKPQTAAGAVTAVDRTAPIPASFAQRRMWFLQQFDPEDSALMMPLLLNLEGRLDATRLAQAFERLVHRHEILRTRLVAHNGEPMQVIDPAGLVTVPFIDLSDRDGIAAQAALETQLAEWLNRAIDLAVGPLCSARIFRLGVDYHVFAVKMHHVVSDGWSIGLMQRELASLYADATPRPAPTLQYADYAAWQRSHIGDAVLARQTEYWQKQLADPPKLDMPSDFPRRPGMAHRGGALPVRLEPDVSNALRRLARAEGVTSFTALLCAYHLVLRLFTGQTRHFIGTAAAGRDHRDSADMLGVFINTLVLNVAGRADTRVRDLLRQVRDTVVAAQSHADIPFDQLVEVLAPERDLDSNPLYQAMFGLQNTPTLDAEFRIGDSLAYHRGFAIKDVQVEVSLDLFDTGETVVGTLEYSASLFKESTMARFLAVFQHTVAQMAANPDAALAELTLLPAEETQLQVKRWNKTASAPPTVQSLHQAFEQQVLRNGDAVAVAMADETWSYRDLNTTANRIAHRLIAAGVRCEQPIPLCARRSPAYLAALIGIAKAGAVYVPLDPALPAERLRHMCTAVGAEWVLTDAASRSQVPAETPSWVLEEILADTDLPDHNPQRPVHDRQLAYILFTSGSTGRPKGVLLEQRGVVNHKFAMIAQLGLCAGESLAQTAAPSFDISIWQFWTALLVGGTTRIVPSDIVRDPRALLNHLGRYPVHLLQLVPSMITAMLREIEEDVRLADGLDNGVLRWMIPTGEALPTEAVALWFKRFQKIPLLNAYGPAECSDDVLLAVLDQNLDADQETPIGFPINNMRAYLLAPDSLQPVPIGAVGELFIGGIGVGRGYHGQSARTAASFIPDPYADEAGARLYRSGDLAYRREDGNLVFVGRADHQVKIRGYRIELGEIESVLLARNEVAEAVVVVHGDGASARLAAYVCGRDLDRDALRAELRDRLPAYMVPSYLTVLTQFPRLPNGKLNRHALPEPEVAVKRTVVAPRNAIERALADCWSQLLDNPAISIDDNFFDLGGHSLLAMRVLGAVRSRFQRELSLRTLFEQPTIRQLAALLQQENQGGGPAAVPVPPRPAHGRLPLSFTQERLWFLEQIEPGTAAYNIPYALRLHGPLDVAALETAFTVLIAQQELLRTRFGREQGRPYQEVLPPHPFTLTVDEKPADRDAASLSADYAARGFDLTAEPAWRAGLVRDSDHSHLLLMNFHHIIFDGWSSNLLLGGLFDAYGRAAAGETPQLETLPLQFADLALQQQAWAQTGALTKQLDFWRAQLADAPGLLPLPWDKPRPALQRFRGRDLSFQLSPEQRDGMADLARQERATLFMVGLALFQLQMARNARRRDICVGTPIAGREHPAGQALIGPFINTLVLRSQVDETRSFREFLATVRDTSLRAFAHAETPFERIVDALAVPRDMSHSPLFQVMFSYLAEENEDNAPAAVTDTDDRLQLAPLDVALDVAKFDLTLQLADHDGGLIASLEYNRDLFEAHTVARLAAEYRDLVTAVLAHPDRPMAALAGQIETDAALTQARGPRLPRPATAERCLPEALRAVALAHPEQTALIYGETRVLFADLYREVDQTAARLQQLGVARGDVVALHLPRERRFFSALLACWRLGAAYLPLNPELPSARRCQMLQQGRVKVVIQSDQTDLDSLLTHDVANLNLNQIEPIDPVLTAPNRPTDPEAIAYILFTSGSTGQPKAVSVPFRALNAHAHAMAEHFNLHAGDRVLQFAAMNFDVLAEEVFPTWLVGAAVCPLELPAVDGLAGFHDYLTRQAVSVLNLPSSFWTEWLRWAANSNHRPPAALRLMVVGSDMAPAGEALRWRQWAPAVPLHNAYGLTESTITCTLFNADQTEQREGGLPIGRPIAGSETWVLDPWLRPVAPGVLGELYLGGACLAAGYVADPTRTAERFVPHPFAEKAGARLYRTGDLAKWDAEGQLVLAGRADHQVKIRGYRVELGEIEAALLGDAEVGEAAVLAVGQGRELRLVAFVGAITCELADLTARLKARLPDYMVPRQWLVRDALPRTAGGKIDRRRLEVPAPASGRRADTRRAGDETENRLALIWAEVLGTTDTDADLATIAAGLDVAAKFFELGGDSLKILALQHHIEATFARRISVVDLFETNTIEGQARLLRGQTGTAAEPAPQAARTLAPNEPIAIIGMAGRFPEADDIQQFLDNLAAARDSVRPIEHDRLHYSSQPHQPYQINGHLRRIDTFDHAFFGLSRAEAVHMEPNHRFALELAAAAVEDAGYGLKAFAGSRTGVVMSAPDNPMYSTLFDELSPVTLTGTTISALAGRIAYLLDLRGPATMVDTACSSSLTAVYEACRMLRDGSVDTVLAGGFNLQIGFGERAEEGENLGVMSLEGKTRAFDAAAAGTGSGEGAAVLLLKPLSRALADKDPIHAVIRGMAANQDGGRSNGLSAPSVAAQEEVLLAAWRDAAIEPSQLGYLEAHGTGTQLGDPVEFQALTRAFARRTDARDICALGSVKTNLGHLDYAAGVAGLVKAVGSVQRGRLFPSLHFEAPNPMLNYEESALYVNTEHRAWPAAKAEPLAGVSSFGISGTNVHLVVGQAPALVEPTTRAATPQLIVLSAKDQDGLIRYRRRVADWLSDSAQKPDLATLAQTLAAGRDTYPVRWCVVVDSRDDLLAALKTAGPDAGDSVDATHLGHAADAWQLTADTPLTIPNDIVLQDPRFAAFARIFSDSGAFPATGPRVLAACLAQLQAWSLTPPVCRLIGFDESVGNALVARLGGTLQAENEALVWTPSETHITAVDALDTAAPDRLLLRVAARQIAAGADCDWSTFFANQPRLRCHAPTYPFAATRCWPLPAGQPKTFDFGEPVRRQVWLYAGGGTQYAAMGRFLFQEETVFRQSIEDSAAFVRDRFGLDLIDALFADETESQLDQPLWTHLGVVAVQLALTDLLRHQGHRPEVVLGHSMGELPAAYACGALNRNQVLDLTYHRGRAMDEEQDRGGAMLLVACSAAVARLLIQPHADRIWIAAHNSSESTVLAGHERDLAALKRQLDENEVFNQYLNVRIASHSPLMEGVADAMLHRPQPLRAQPLTAAMMSTSRADWVTAEQLADPNYWAENVLQPVAFDKAMDRLLEEADCHFLEISPHPVLKPVTQQMINRHGRGKVSPTMHRAQTDTAWLQRLGQTPTPTPAGANPAQSWGRLNAASDDPLLVNLAQSVGATLHLENFDAAQNLFELGLNSLLAIRLLKDIERLTGMNLTIRDLYSAPDLHQLAALIRGRTGQTAARAVDHPALVPLNSEPDKATLFMVHPGGGDVMSYTSLASALRGKLGLTGLRARGLDGDEPAHDAIPAMAAYYADAVQQAQPQGDLYLGGWSLGGIVAVECAAVLRERGRHIAKLVLIDAGNLTVMDPGLADELAADESAQLVKMFGDLGLTVTSPLNWQRVFEQAQQHGILPEGFNDPELLAGLVRVTLAHDRALVAHQPRPVDAPLLLLRAAERPPELEPYPDYAWSTLCAAQQTVDVQGNHASVLEQPQLTGLVATLLEYL